LPSHQFGFLNVFILEVCIMTQWPSGQSANNLNGNSAGLNTPQDDRPPLDQAAFSDRAVAVLPFPHPSSPQFASSGSALKPETAANSVFVQPLQWWRGRKLGFKVMTLAVALATLPVMGIGGVAYRLTNKIFTERVEAESRDYSLSVQNKINLFLRQRLGDIQVVSQSSVFADPRLRAEATAQQKQDALDRFIAAYETYDSIAVTDLNGNVIAQSIGERLPNLRDRQYFQEALEANRPIVSQPEPGTLTKVLSIYVVAPIRDSITGATVGLIQARIPGDLFRMAVLSEEVQNRAIKIYLVDGNGKLFVTPEGVGAAAVDEQGRPIVDAEGEVQAIEAQSVFAGYEQWQNAAEPVVDLSSQEVVTLTPIEDLRDLAPLGWKLLITENKATAFAAQSQLLLTLQVGTTIAIVLAGAVAALIANRTIIPILAATNTVTRIGQGNLDARVTIQGKDEIAVLGANINQMAAQLQQSIEARAFEASKERILTAAKGSGAIRQADLQDIFDHAVVAVRELLNLDRVVIYQFADGNGVVSESVGANWSSAIAQQVEDSCIPEPIRDAYSRGHVGAIHDVSRAPLHPEHLKLLNDLQVRSSLIVPVLSGDRPFGLLIGHACSSLRHWQDDEIEFMKQLGTELGLSIYRVTLLEETEKLAKEQQQLKEQLQSRALELLQEVEPIGQGDLTIRAKVTGDEIGTIADSYNATVDNLRKLVLQVKAAVSQVVTTTQVNQLSIQTLSADATRQVEEITIALKRVEEVVETVREVATNAKQAESIIKKATKTVQVGDAAIERIVAGNQMIRDTVTETAAKVEHLSTASKQISSVVDLISSFAAQTRMLAFNVSIEAGRAGGEGQVIHTIAREVHALVKQSEDAAKEIRQLVAAIQTETNEVAAAMESSTEQVTQGTQLVDETRHSLQEVTHASLQINQLVQAIAQATTVQQQASETIAQTMTGVTAIAEKTSTETKQVSSSFDQLRQVAQLLQTGVDRFKVN
jgi:methyl-accepting chemotaxis protein PixJ